VDRFMRALAVCDAKANCLIFRVSDGKGWRAKGVLGFAWCAGADVNHPHPFIRVVRIDENNHTPRI